MIDMLFKPTDYILNNRFNNIKKYFLVKLLYIIAVNTTYQLKYPLCITYFTKI